MDWSFWVLLAPCPGREPSPPAGTPLLSTLATLAVLAHSAPQDGQQAHPDFPCFDCGPYPSRCPPELEFGRTPKPKNARKFWLTSIFPPRLAQIVRLQDTAHLVRCFPATAAGFFATIQAPAKLPPESVDNFVHKLSARRPFSRSPALRYTLHKICAIFFLYKTIA